MKLIIILLLLLFILILYSCYSIKEGLTNQPFLLEQEKYYEGREHTLLPTDDTSEKFYKFDMTKPLGHQLEMVEATEYKNKSSEIDANVARCKSIKSCKELDNTNCGYCFSSNKFIYGNENKPFTDVCEKGWVKTTSECEEYRERAICNKITKCSDMVGEASICAWCPTTNKAMPYIEQDGILVPKYPNKDTCNDPSLTSSTQLGLVKQSQCDAFEKDHPCIGPNENTGPHSSKCLQHLWKTSGCSTKGSKYPTTNNPQTSWWNKRSWKAVFEDMKALFSNANSSNWNLAKDNYKACYGNDPDPCDPKYNGPLECYQKQFISNGCKENGNAYPKSKPTNGGIASFIKQVKDYVTQSHDQNLPFDKRNTAYGNCYGGHLVAPTYSETKLTLNPTSFVMYGPWIEHDNVNEPVDKIIIEGDQYIFISQRGSDVKIVKTDQQLNNQKGFYFKGVISEYGSKPLISTPQGSYNIRLNTNIEYKGCYKDTRTRAMTDLNKIMTYNDAIQYGKEQGFKYIGLQYANGHNMEKASVFGSNDEEYTKYGKATNCNRFNTGEIAGGSWSNAVYQISNVATP